jgi:uncharacterized membrane protein HdeD (DUF308 family)
MIGSPDAWILMCAVIPQITMNPMFALGQGTPIAFACLFVVVLGIALVIGGAISTVFTRSPRSQKFAEKAALAGCLIIIVVILGFAVLGLVFWASKAVWGP